MKIAHVVDSMEVGGAETLVLQLCYLQREQGHTPSVFALASLGDLGARLQKDGFAVHAEVGRHFFRAATNFMRLFKELRPDVVHLHNPTPTIYAAIPARLAVASSIVSTRHSLVAPPHELVQELKYCIAGRFCDWIVGVSDATTRNLRDLHLVPGRKLVRVYNGAVPLIGAPYEQCPPKTGFTFLYVGRLQPVKNHRFLFHAFHIALSSQPDLRLWMVGGGSERTMLGNLAAELGIAAEVTFWGQQLDVVPFFSAADAFVMSSKSEGLPVSLLQAFSLGLPAIVTDVGGMAEAVRLANAGLVVSSTDPGEMAGAIVRMARDDAERKRFSENAESAFLARFNLQTMADTYMGLYRGERRLADSDRRRMGGSNRAL
jgi:glycosyltransferase involved in cell wall biosynthesis